MVFPGFVRRVLKLMPTILQAVALVVFLHIVGQVNNKYRRTTGEGAGII